MFISACPTLETVVDLSFALLATEKDHQEVEIF